ncbi:MULTISPECIES: LpqB family beta-propeller domain-containing protein [Streptomyces]|uniref:LpqB family beta-propeller domain-containing protein n=1 Tax=Streptomyces TaxID=1883 RepID=UPI0023B93D1A|nr:MULTISPECIES: LpqB family beta-propeller domain-containing protein [unclassified Streptomyces]MDT0425409.1 LpqB family beta-propeller domain-containing protein [Streptomyces sp. DSM 41859]WEH31735.1 LpqB family beta-propeller domain-containing protein [Streptomyces sp. AM 3-1-1]
MPGPRRRWGGGLVLATVGALVAGCASMPDHGDVQPVDSSTRNDPRVRVFGVAPRDGARPIEVVDGFLEALTSEDRDYAVARKYLTEKASEDWHPGSGTTVLTDSALANPSRGTPPNEADDAERATSYTYVLTGKKVATVDDRLSYHPSDATYQETVRLVRTGKDKKEWRIDRPPTGVVLGKNDFQRLYWPVNKYYFAARGEAGRQPLVADPVYIRSWEDSVTQTVKAVLDGPSGWLGGVARSSFPDGVALRRGTTALVPDDDNRLTVPLDVNRGDVSAAECRKMATQLLYSLRDLASTSVKMVELRARKGSLCTLDEDEADAVVRQGGGKSGQPGQYYLDKDHRLVNFDDADDDGVPGGVPGPLGTGDQELRSAAVSRDEKYAAGVSLNGDRLFVSALAGTGELRFTGVRSKAADEKDRLSTPSWDGFGDLWVADTDPGNPRLMWVRNGSADPVEVKVAGLGEGDRIEAVRASSDGVRIALLVREGKQTTLRIGRVERVGEGEATKISIGGLRAAAPQLEEVTAMSWAGGSRLVVAGREEGGVRQLQYVLSDGSVPPKSTLPGLNGVTDIAAADDPSLPLIAHSSDGIVRLPAGMNWETVSKQGTGPFYPG